MSAVFLATGDVYLGERRVDENGNATEVKAPRFEPKPLMRYVSCAFGGYCGTCSLWDRDTRSCREIVRAPQSWRYIRRGGDE